jgi:small subunit ribosomal protein S9
MAEEEQNEETPETPPETDPEVSAEAEEESAGSDPEGRSEAPQPEGSDPTGSEDQPEGSDPTESGAQTPEPEEPPVAEEPPAEEPQAESQDKPAKDRPPGADLEPIAIEDERELTAEERARREAEEEERAAREQAAASDSSEEPATRRRAAEVPADARIQATGKRKSAIARVILTSGSGEFSVNSRDIDEYFPRPRDRTVARQALVTAGYESNVDVTVRVHGGGISGQAGAVRHGIARALTEVEPELRRDLKRRGLLTRDARAKERRKAGLKKARKRPQFSKR